MAKAHGSVRMGPISLFTLIVVLCLAVMVVLSLATAQAGFAVTQRQASTTSDTYRNEVAAQEFVAGVDAALATVRNGDNGDNGDASGDSAADAVPPAHGSKMGAACAAVSAALPALSANEAYIDGNMVHATFTVESDRSLSIALEITDGATYKVVSWKATTLWTEEAGGNLWQGARTGLTS